MIDFNSQRIILTKTSYHSFLTKGERLERFGLGKRILLQNVTSEELNKAIDYVTGSEEVKRKVGEVSEAVRKDDAMDRLCDLIEETCSRKDP